MAAETRRLTERLHLGRISAAGSAYFVTFVTTARTPWLAAPPTADAMLTALQAWHAERDGVILAASVMPDHVHVLFVLGARLDVGRCVSRWKTVGRRGSGYAGEWQRDFWEHRVRDDDSWGGLWALYFFEPVSRRAGSERCRVAVGMDAGAEAVSIYRNARNARRTAGRVDRLAGGAVCEARDGRMRFRSRLQKS